jgi:malate/lactate dehydrogenase
VSTEQNQLNRVAVVGAGNVGASFAYALLLSGPAAEIVLIDVNRERAEGEAMDLNHSVPFAHAAHIWAGDYDDCAGAAVTVITGAGRVRIVEAILRNQRTVLTISSVVDGPYGLSNVALSLPTVVDRGGVEQVIKLRLAVEEEAGLLDSARILRESITSLDA